MIDIDNLKIVDAPKINTTHNKLRHEYPSKKWKWTIHETGKIKETLHLPKVAMLLYPLLGSHQGYQSGISTFDRCPIAGPQNKPCPVIIYKRSTAQYKYFFNISMFCINTNRLIPPWDSRTYLLIILCDRQLEVPSSAGNKETCSPIF